jgi:hypothetical protein
MRRKTVELIDVSSLTEFSKRWTSGDRRIAIRPACQTRNEIAVDTPPDQPAAAIVSL